MNSLKKCMVQMVAGDFKDIFLLNKEMKLILWTITWTTLQFLDALASLKTMFKIKWLIK